jgi:hypothetical protein
LFILVVLRLSAFRMRNELDIVRDVSSRLDSAGLGYMLTGSMAMNYYAQPRMTRDIDVVLAVGPEDTDRVLALFSPEYYASREAILGAITQRSMFNLIDQESVIKVDCIIRKESVYRRVEFERRQRVTIQDFQTWIVAIEDLILSKLEWARESHSELQFRDIQNLARTGFDSPYLNRWLKQLGLAEVWEQALHE